VVHLYCKFQTGIGVIVILDVISSSVFHYLSFKTDSSNIASLAGICSAETAILRFARLAEEWPSA
jgi:CMP-N-acetylneuraminic acid synthetase